jgi:hypothetical protein
MTGLAESANAAERLQHGDGNRPAKATRQTEPRCGVPSGPSAIGGRHRLGWLTCGIAGCLAIGWFIFFSPGESGSKAEWFFGAVVFAVVLVAIWQTVTIQRQAIQNAAEAAERLRTKLAAGEANAGRAPTEMCRHSWFAR